MYVLQPLKHVASKPISRLILAAGFALIIIIFSTTAKAAESTSPKDICWLAPEQQGVTVAFEMLRLVHISKQCKDINPDITKSFADVQSKFGAPLGSDTRFVEEHFKRLYGTEWKNDYKRFLGLSLENIKKQYTPITDSVCTATNSELQKIGQGTWEDFLKTAKNTFPPNMGNALNSCK